MKRWEEQISVEAPADKVFAYVSDFARHAEWSGHGLQVTQAEDGPVRVGTTFTTVAKQFGTQRERSTVTELTPSSRFGWDSTGALGRIHHWFSVRDDGARTILSKGLELAEPKFLAKLMGFRIAKESPKGLRSDLEKIKASVERL